MNFRVKFLRRKPAKVNPQSQKLTDDLVAMLNAHGLVDKQRQALCAKAMLESTAKYFQNIQKGKDVSIEVFNATERMKAALAEHGIADQPVQEEIILEFLSNFHENVIAAVKK